MLSKVNLGIVSLERSIVTIPLLQHATITPKGLRTHEKSRLAMTNTSECSHVNNTKLTTTEILNGQESYLFGHGHWDWAADPQVAFEQLTTFPQSVNATAVWDKENLSKPYWVGEYFFPISGVNYVNPNIIWTRAPF